MPMRDRDILATYREAHEAVVAAGFESEIRWQEEAGDFDETDLLRESAWVILCSGFRERTVRRLFDYISLCFFDWDSSDLIQAHGDICVETALGGFGNRRKIEAIRSVAAIIAETGFRRIKDEIDLDPLKSLIQFPYIGAVTVFHLAKNLGFDVAKPDRHLLRTAKRLGENDPHVLCQRIAELTGDPVRVVDIIFWRYATLSSEGSQRPKWLT